jgi:DNA-nicking Smr family endonuclease
MRDVKRIPGKGRKQPVQMNSPAADAPKPSPPRSYPPAPLSVKTGAVLPPLAMRQSADVDGRTLDRLRRGRLRPEERLDLHGLTQEKAHRALTRFIARAYTAGVRSIIIITGKGKVSEGGGVLRTQVPQWLNTPAIRPRILAFTPAQPKDGGAGALYVLLRRQR